MNIQKTHGIAILDRPYPIDVQYAKIVHINNKQRLIRALEIYESTGKNPSDHFQIQKLNPTAIIKLYTIFLKWERTKQSIKELMKEQKKCSEKDGLRKFRAY